MNPTLKEALIKIIDQLDLTISYMKFYSMSTDPSMKEKITQCKRDIKVMKNELFNLISQI